MGRAVFQQDLGRVVPSGEGNTFAWDCHGGDGRRVPSGMFWAAVTIDGDRQVRKFTILR
jgi:hypothetical protein